MSLRFLKKGTLIDDKYRIEELIGAGGMGAVYRAVYLSLSRNVAIKILHRKLLGKEQVVARFQQEARIAGSLGHDNVCEVTELGTTRDGSPYLVMPLLKGKSLAELVSGEKRLPLARALDIIAQTLSALDAAHRNRIVHRDLKPDNIFITQVGDRKDFVKVLDFGISKGVDRDSMLDLTRSGAVFGTPVYMSPEQTADASRVDHRTDIYAIGATLFRILTGEAPFSGNSIEELRAHILSGAFARPRKIAPEIPKALEQIILKAMAVNASERYASASSMLAALREAMHQDEPSHLSVADMTTIRPPCPETTLRSPKREPSSPVMDTLNHAATTHRESGPRSRLLSLISAPAVVLLGAVFWVLASNTRSPRESHGQHFSADTDTSSPLKSDIDVPCFDATGRTAQAINMCTFDSPSPLPIQRPDCRPTASDTVSDAGVDEPKENGVGAASEDTSSGRGAALKARRRAGQGRSSKQTSKASHRGDGRQTGSRRDETAPATQDADEKEPSRRPSGADVKSIEDYKNIYRIRPGGAHE